MRQPSKTTEKWCPECKQWYRVLYAVWICQWCRGRLKGRS